MEAERSLVRYLQAKGLSATKTSRTGYSGTDLSVDLLGISRSIECKVRSHGFAQIYSWLADSDLLIVRSDRKEPLVILPLWLGAEIAAAAEQHEQKRAHSSLSSSREGDAPVFLSRQPVGEG
jgi:hypothetical protein